MTDQSIRHIGVVGAGTIGASWAAYFAAPGLDVTVTDPSPGAKDLVARMLEKAWPVLTELGLADGASPDRVRVAPPGTLPIGDVDFVQESGPEREDVKIALFREIDTIVRPAVIIASSSSGLLISPIQAASQHPERCLIGHPFNPPHLIPLVEVVCGERTSANVAKRAMAFYAAIGKKPILLHKEVRGHIANRLQAALFREAIHLFWEGGASLADIDAAVAHGPGLRWALMGPSRTFHLAGGDGGLAHFLDHIGGPMQDWWDDLGAPRLTPEVIRRMVAEIDDVAGGKTIGELAQTRDAFLIELLQRLKQTRPA